jgi:hypothetical protein
MWQLRKYCHNIRKIIVIVRKLVAKKESEVRIQDTVISYHLNTDN